MNNILYTSHDTLTMESFLERRYHIAGKFGGAKVWQIYSFWAFGEKKVWQMNRFSQKVINVSRNLDGFSWRIKDDSPNFPVIQ